MSLLLTGGGCRTSLGGRVRHTGRAAALIRIPVIPGVKQETVWWGSCAIWSWQPLSCEFLPASAGWTGLDPFRFFTGTVGTLQEKKTKPLVQNISVPPNKGTEQLWWPPFPTPEFTQKQKRDDRRVWADTVSTISRSKLSSQSRRLCSGDPDRCWIMRYNPQSFHLITEIREAGITQPPAGDYPASSQSPRSSSPSGLCTTGANSHRFIFFICSEYFMEIWDICSEFIPRNKNLFSPVFLSWNWDWTTMCHQVSPVGSDSSSRTTLNCKHNSLS